MIKKVNNLQFWLGDLVRIKQKKSTFEKGERLYSDSVYKVVKIKPLGTMKLEDLNGKILKRTFKDYQLLYVGRSITDIEGKASRAQVVVARKKARTKRRLGQEGVSRENILRRGREIGKIMAPKKKRKRKKKEPEKFEIEKLIRRFKAGNNENFYEVKWKGYSETTNEPRSNLLKDVPEMVKEFEKKK